MFLTENNYIMFTNKKIKEIIDYSWNTKKNVGIIDLLRTVSITKDYKRCPTMGVDINHKLLINKRFLNKNTTEANFNVLCHEYMHNVYNHFERAIIYKHDNFKISNIAADIVVNEFLKKSFGIIIPDACYKENIENSFDVKFKKMDFNSIYQTLNNKVKRNTKIFASTVKKFVDDMKNNNMGRMLTREEITEIRKKLKNVSQSDLKKALDELEKLESEMAQGNNNTNKDEKEADNNDIGSKASETGFSSKLATLFKDFKADYLVVFLNKQLGKLLTNSFHRSWSRPNRYNIKEMPAYRSEKPTPKIGIYIDISGSMGSLPNNILSMLKNLESKLFSYRPDFYVFNEELRKLKSIDEEIKIGGGTDINLVLDNINKQDDYSIIFSDMESSIRNFEKEKVLFFTNQLAAKQKYKNKVILTNEDFSKIISDKELAEMGY